MKVYAPGKLILSGEHAVIYGRPALAMAVNRYAVATITRSVLSRLDERARSITFDLSDLAHRGHLNLDAIRHLKNRIKRKYYKFIRGDFSIRDVLHKPFELAQFAFSIFVESLNLSLPHGVHIHIQSDIPMGCGMGSSAATILSVMHAVSNHLQLTLSSESLFQIALEAEKMQHGFSSGLDLRTSLQGGCLYMHGQDIKARSLPLFSMYLVNTGTPITSTGQCIEKVTNHFKSQQLADEFAAVTDAMDEALQQQSWNNMQAAIRDNYELLVKIGVVPERVQRFITDIAAAGGAAKICGAGAVAGDSAGAVLIAHDDYQVVSALAMRYGYTVAPIVFETRGVHVV